MIDDVYESTISLSDDVLCMPELTILATTLTILGLDMPSLACEAPSDHADRLAGLLSAVVDRDRIDTSNRLCELL